MKPRPDPDKPGANSKSEARNPKQIRMIQIRITQTYKQQLSATGCVHLLFPCFEHLKIRISDLFRISDFVLRISCAVHDLKF